MAAAVCFWFWWMPQNYKRRTREDEMTEIRNRLEKNVKKLVDWAEKHQIEAYRIYDRDIPDYPFVVDVYKDYFVIYDRGNEAIDSRDEKREHLPQLLTSIKEIFSTDDEHIILKRRARQKGESQYDKVGTSGKTFVVRESQALFEVNLYDYLDTGLFLDHRLMRQTIYKMANGKDFLNLFAYTGSVSVFAALAGARTVSVDMSATYTRWAEDNFRLNKIPLTKHEFITQNAIEFLEDRSQKRTFDLIFLDPPTFSNSKRMDSTFEVERDQEPLVQNTMHLLRPDGVLYFSNNKRSFKISPKLLEQFTVKDITSKTIPKDMRDPKVHVVFEVRHQRS